MDQARIGYQCKKNTILAARLDRQETYDTKFHYIAKQIADFVDAGATHSAQNNPQRAEGRPHE